MSKIILGKFCAESKVHEREKFIEKFTLYISTNYFNSTITIWRKEEIVKVTIHEMIHALVREQVEDSSELIIYLVSSPLKILMVGFFNSNFNSALL